MCPSPAAPAHESLDLRTKEELVTFNNVLPWYPPEADLILGYTLGSRVSATPRDWIGIFRSDWRTRRQPLTFLWAPTRSNQGCKLVEGRATFPAELIKPLKDPVDKYQFLYVSYDNKVIQIIGSNCGLGQASASPNFKSRDSQSKSRDSRSSNSESLVLLSSDDDWEFPGYSAPQQTISPPSDISDIVILSSTPDKHMSKRKVNVENKDVGTVSPEMTRSTLDRNPQDSNKNLEHTNAGEGKPNIVSKTKTGVNGQGQQRLCKDSQILGIDLESVGKYEAGSKKTIFRKQKTERSFQSLTKLKKSQKAEPVWNSRLPISGSLFDQLRIVQIESDSDNEDCNQELQNETSILNDKIQVMSDMCKCENTEPCHSQANSNSQENQKKRKMKKNGKKRREHDCGDCNLCTAPTTTATDSDDGDEDSHKPVLSVSKHEQIIKTIYNTKVSLQIQEHQTIIDKNSKDRCGMKENADEEHKFQDLIGTQTETSDASKEVCKECTLHDSQNKQELQVQDSQSIGKSSGRPAQEKVLTNKMKGTHSSPGKGSPVRRDETHGVGRARKKCAQNQKVKAKKKKLQVKQALQTHSTLALLFNSSSEAQKQWDSTRRQHNNLIGEPALEVNKQINIHILQDTSEQGFPALPSASKQRRKECGKTYSDNMGEHVESRSDISSGDECELNNSLCFPGTKYLPSDLLDLTDALPLLYSVQDASVKQEQEKPAIFNTSGKSVADPDGLPLLTAALGSPGAESSINTAPSARICSGSLSAEKCNVGSVSDEIITAACDCGASGSTLHRPLSYASIVKKYKEDQLAEREAHVNTESVFLDVSASKIPSDCRVQSTTSSNSTDQESHKSYQELTAESENAMCKLQGTFSHQTLMKWNYELPQSEAKICKELDNMFLREKLICDSKQKSQVRSTVHDMHQQERKNSTECFISLPESTETCQKDINQMSGDSQSSPNCSENIQSHQEKISESDSCKFSLSWPLPAIISSSFWFGPWVTPNDVVEVCVGDTAEVPVLAEACVHSQPESCMCTNTLPHLQGQGQVTGLEEEASTSPSQMQKIVTLERALRLSHGENEELRERFELLKAGCSLQEPGLAGAVHSQAVRANKIKIKMVRNRRVPLLKSAGHVRDLVRSNAEILILRSKVKSCEMQIRDMESEMFGLKEALRTATRKALKAHLKWLRLNLKIKAQNLRFREVTEKPQKKTAHAKVKVFSEQENWCSPLDYEPPRKKRRTGGETALVDDDDDEEERQGSAGDKEKWEVDGRRNKSQQCKASVEELGETYFRDLWRMSGTDLPQQVSYLDLTNPHYSSSVVDVGGRPASCVSRQEAVLARYSPCINTWACPVTNSSLTTAHPNLITSYMQTLDPRRHVLSSPGTQCQLQNQLHTHCTETAWPFSHTVANIHASPPRLVSAQHPDTHFSFLHCARYEQEQSRCPRLEQEQSRCPRLAHEQSRCPRLEQEQSRCPRLEQEQSRCPRLAHEQSRCPRIEHEQSRCPRLAHEQSRCPRLEQEQSRCPRPEQEQSRCPRLEQEQSRCPRRDQEQNRSAVNSCSTSKIFSPYASYRISRRCRSPHPPPYLPLSCNNSRNKSRESSLSPSQHLASPVTLPDHNRITRSTSRSSLQSPPKITVSHLAGASMHKHLRNQATNSCTALPPAQGVTGHINSHRHSSESPHSRIWNSKLANDRQSVRGIESSHTHVCSSDIRKLSFVAGNDPKVKVRLPPFHISRKPTSSAVSAIPKRFAFASGATVCPESNLWWSKHRKQDMSESATVKSATSPELYERGQRPTLINPEFNFPVNQQKAVTAESPHLHFQSCFLQQLMKSEDQRQQPCLQQQQGCEDLVASHGKSKNSYLKPPLTIPPSELPYPPLSPFQQTSSTQLRKVDTFIPFQNESVAGCNNQTLDGYVSFSGSNNRTLDDSVAEGTPHNAFLSNYRQLIRPNGPGVSCTCSSTPKTCSQTQKNQNANSIFSNSESVVELSKQGLITVHGGRTCTNCGLLFGRHINKRQIEENVACHSHLQK